MYDSDYIFLLYFIQHSFFPGALGPIEGGYQTMKLTTEVEDSVLCNYRPIPTSLSRCSATGYQQGLEAFRERNTTPAQFLYHFDGRALNLNIRWWQSSTRCQLWVCYVSRPQISSSFSTSVYWNSCCCELILMCLSDTHLCTGGEFIPRQLTLLQFVPSAS